MKLGISLSVLFLIAAIYLLWRPEVERVAHSGTVARVRVCERAPAGPIQLPLGTREIVVEKQRRLLTLFVDGRAVRTYRVALGFSPRGTKQRRGDGKTPEGSYYIGIKNPQSRYYLSLGLSYPNTQDAMRGLGGRLISQSEAHCISRAIGRGVMPPQNSALGGDIFIHGGGSGGDWTHGCIALDNENMRELFEIVALGTTVTIKP